MSKDVSWDDLPHDLQRHALGQLSLPQATQAGLAGKDILERVKEDMRWNAIAPGAGHQGAVEVLNRMAHGPRTRQVVRQMPVDVSQFARLRHSDDYFTASVADWQQQQETLGSNKAAWVAAKLEGARQGEDEQLMLYAADIRTLPACIGELGALRTLFINNCHQLTCKSQHFT